MTEQAARAVYIVVDTSGSTVRGGFAAACGQALPALIDQAQRHDGTLVSVIGYGSEAQVLLWLTPPADIQLIPPLATSGLSSLAAGLRMMAASAESDRARLADDGIGWRAPVVFVVADALPTDSAQDLLTARDEVDSALGPAPPHVHAALPAATDWLAVAGLRMTPHPMTFATPAECAGAIVAAFGTALTSSD